MRAPCSRGICVATPHNYALHIMRDVAKTVGEPLIEALGEEASLPFRLDEMQIRVSKGGLVGLGVPLSGDELGSVEWLSTHRDS
jgi:hypothetical protein